MKSKWLVVVPVCGVVLLVGTFHAYSTWSNSRVIRELHENPEGERANRVMVLTLPSGKTLPVNYLRDGDTVYAAADFPWWRELRDGGGAGSVWVRGETLPGRVRVVEDDPDLRSSVFARLRPTAPSFTGTLIVVDLE